MPFHAAAQLPPPRSPTLKRCAALSLPPPQVDAVQTNLKAIGGQMETSAVRLSECESMLKMHADKEREHQVGGGSRGSGPWVSASQPVTCADTHTHRGWAYESQPLVRRVVHTET